MAADVKSELAAALAAAQAEIRDPERNKSGQVRGRPNYKYAGLDDLLQAVRPVLARHGLAVSQTIELQGEHVCLVTQLRHGSGEALASTCPLAWTGGPQDKGSELSYMRRYSLEALVGVAATDDDDGDTAQQHAPQANQRREPPPPSSQPPPGGNGAAPASGGGQRGRWDTGEQRAFFAALGRIEGAPSYETLAAWCEAHGRPRPSEMAPKQRQTLLAWLSEAPNRAAVLAASTVDSAQAEAGAA